MKITQSKNNSETIDTRNVSTLPWDVFFSTSDHEKVHEIFKKLIKEEEKNLKVKKVAKTIILIGSFFILLFVLIDLISTISSVGFKSNTFTTIPSILIDDIKYVYNKVTTSNDWLSFILWLCGDVYVFAIFIFILYCLDTDRFDKPGYFYPSESEIMDLLKNSKTHLMEINCRKILKTLIRSNLKTQEYILDKMSSNSNVKKDIIEFLNKNYKTNFKMK